MLENHAKLSDAVQSGFTATPVLVVGDCMLDRYIWGTVGRISPEAPIPIVSQSRETTTGGGAANVALNLSQLGLKVRLAGFIGNDAAGSELQAILANHNIGTDGLLALDDRPTITKTRIMGGRQQMLRIDREDLTPVASQEIHRLIASVEQLLGENPAVMVLSDYAKGALPPALCQAVILAGRAKNIPVIIDPKGDDFSKYRGATALSPNRLELATGASAAPDDLDPLLLAGQALVAQLSLEFMVVTLGDQGIALVEPDRIQRIPAVAQDVFDVSGAGDTVIATLAAGLAAGLTRSDSIALANLAGGIVVGQVGTAPIRSSDLANALADQNSRSGSGKIIEIKSLAEQVAQWKRRGEKVVFTNGCFDLLHPGHVAYLGAARALGSHLIVGLNTDRSVRALKGPGRPVMEAADRAQVLAGLAAVDRVILFDEDTPLELIMALRPDILAKGGDYSKNDIVGASEVEGYGGKVAIIPLVEGQSTSRLIEQLLAARNKD
ncbi:MAG: D-glycero-beta-D-manno-heptose-7-phosphate kinase [Candidatus Marinimicrobia bacterium]|nr:D-glycero-beta-D-manno-heptose-7-phosphate kinase [Candidatus Neomarinimicrobiota bacterium]